MSARLELVWPNKDKFLLVPRDADGKPVWVDNAHPAAAEVRLSTMTDAVGEVGDDPYADNLLFTGDSLDVLRILSEVPEYRRHYRGKVKLIYIDPPFNTGQTFTHYDDWMEHSTWLSFMHDRLKLMRELLAPDGSIWVHLDDAEVHRMRCLLDEIFGAGNFVASVVWQKTLTRRNDARLMSGAHDTMLVYARNLASFSVNSLPATDKQRSTYTNRDNDPRGDWLAIPFHAPGIRPNLTYPIRLPSGRDILPPPGRCWSTTKEQYEALLADNRIYIGSGGDGMPQRKKFWSEADARLTPWTWWPYEEVGENREANREAKSLAALAGATTTFSTPKPERLLQRLLFIASDPGDLVVDVFGGSGTTAAVAHKMGRRWVTAEILRSTVASFTRPRLERVVAGEERGGITPAIGWEGGGGFRCVEVGPSMYESGPGGLVLLADWATNGAFAQAVAGQLGFEFEADASPLCGHRGRMRLAVLDGAIGPEEARELLAQLDERERLTIVAKVVLAGTEDLVAKLSPGSRVRKAPRDLLETGRRRRRQS